MSQAQTQDLSGLDRTRRELRDAGRSLWLAGVGVMAEAEEEGRSLFDRLVEQGRPVEERRRKAVTALTERTSETFKELGKLLQDTVEYESKSIMKRLGLATRDEVKTLSLRVDALTQSIEEMVARWKIEQALARTDVASAPPMIIETPAAAAAKSSRRATPTTKTTPKTRTR
jgi:poly(hydroxyalkanoate) granule-associated protein